MERLFEGKVYEILPLSNGIIFSYLKDELEIGDYVEYKMISFDNRRLSNVVKSTYMLAKFGMDAKEIKRICENYITIKSLIIPGGRVFLLEPDGKSHLVDGGGEIIYSGDLTYKGNKPSDISLVGGALWAVYPDCDVILKYNLSTMREELRIGGAKSPFSRPVDIFPVSEDEIIVSNEGDATLVKINLNNFSVSVEERFLEPVKQYIEVANHKFVILESGLYIL